MKGQRLLIAAFCLTASSMAMAMGTSGKPMATWTCADFLAIDESFQPTAVAVGEALNNKGKVEDAVLDVDGIVSVTPVVIQACTEEPQSSFMDKLKAAWAKVKKAV